MNRRLPQRSLLATLISGALLLMNAASASGTQIPHEPFFPHTGDPRYDVVHYDAHLTYDPTNGRLQAKETIDATALEPVTEFSLDFAHLHVNQVTVNGEAAVFAQTRGKLLVDPSAPLSAGDTFVVAVRYHGHPGAIFEPDTFSGWLRTRDGAAAVGEAQGTRAWLPCNNALADKASFDFYINVPASRKAVSNGRLVGVRRRKGRKTFHWREAQPMDAYLAVIDIGRGRLVRGEAAGVPTWTLVDPAQVDKWKPRLAKVPEILRFETKLLGPYPFDAAGSIVDRFGYDAAIESQTRPIYDLAPLQFVLVHELAHQWFGDSVGLRRWPDIWLNEGFATWVQWYYRERHGGPSVKQIFRRLMRTSADARIWSPPPGRPDRASHLFSGSVYIRGAMTLEALRIKVGTPTMLRILRDWAQEHRYGSVGTGEFITLAEEVSKRPLRLLFKRWLFSPRKPI
jgi:aminopeptidase N